MDKLADRLVFETERKHGPAFFILCLLSQLILAVLANIVVMCLSRWREFRTEGAALSDHQKIFEALEQVRARED